MITITVAMVQITISNFFRYISIEKFPYIEIEEKQN